MKRTLSLILVLLLMALAVPTAFAYEEPAVSSNIDDHWYINAQRWTDPINSALYPNASGYERVEHIGGKLVIEQYDQDFQFVSGKELALELPIYGGVYHCEDYNFLVVGQENPEESDETEVFRIIRYSPDWERQASAGIYGANTLIPFSSGSLRFDRSGDILYIRTSHKMYTADDGLNHQANVMISLRISDMTVTDQLTDVLNRNYGYISHSFNQFVRVDGSTLLAVDHGDALPRGVVLIKYGKAAGGESFYGKVALVTALPIAESTYHYNDTGVSLGGFECSSSHYLIAGNSGDPTVSTNLMYVQRNIFVTATPKDNFTDEGTVCHWLTDFDESSGVSVSPPHLLKLSSDRFFLIWTEGNLLRYCFLDGTGTPEDTVYTAEGDLSDCVPVLSGNRILWYVTNSSEPVFYAIDLADPGTVTNPHAHAYTASVTAPTCTEGGFTTYTCTICGYSRTDDATPALGHAWQEPTCTEPETCSRCGITQGDPYGHDWGDWVVEVEESCTQGGSSYCLCNRCGFRTESVTAPLGHSLVTTVTEPTCTERGVEQTACQRCDYTEDPIYTGALGHDETAAVTAPTCTEGGFTVYTCSRCGAARQSDATAALGHSFGSWETVTASTCVTAGQEQRECVRCGHTETRDLPLADHNYAATVTEPTCTERGFTTHTCTVCGDAYRDTYTDATGHSWDEGTVIREATEDADGEILHTCTACGAQETHAIPSPGHSHSYTAAVTAPLCTEDGFTTYTCRCGDSYVADPVPALGHSYADGKCIRCGIAQPSLSGVIRIAGADRIATSFALADQLKETLGVEKFDTVIVASALNFPDALTGSYLAAVKDAPILLTYDKVHADVVSYITQNMDPDGTVYILGGESAVAAEFEGWLLQIGIRCNRLAGADRIGTNLAIMEEAGVNSTQPILIATATNFADSLSASAVGLPMVLVHGSLREDQKEFLETTSKNFIIIGGFSAVSEELEAELSAIGTVGRLGGSSRYETSVLVAQKFLTAPDAVLLAYARNFPDGLCGGPLAYALGAPLILTDNHYPAEADAYVENIYAGIVVGGSGLISDETVDLIFDRVSPEVPDQP